MITDAILGFFESIVTSILGLLPDIEAPDLAGMVESIHGFFAYFGWANQYVPLDQIVVMLGIGLGSWFAMYLIRFALWALTKAHILGGSSD
jgi:hypothetical protein